MLLLCFRDGAFKIRTVEHDEFIRPLDRLHEIEQGLQEDEGSQALTNIENTKSSPSRVEFRQ